MFCHNIVLFAINSNLWSYLYIYLCLEQFTFISTQSLGDIFKYYINDVPNNFEFGQNTGFDLVLNRSTRKAANFLRLLYIMTIV